MKEYEEEKARLQKAKDEQNRVLEETKKKQEALLANNRIDLAEILNQKKKEQQIMSLQVCMYVMYVCI